MTETAGLFQSFAAPGPKAAGWLHSNAPMSFIMGPVGSAKTTTGAMKCLNVARRQHPSTKDGVRKAHILAVRKNYRQMHRSLLPSWFSVWPREFGEVDFEKDGPVKHTIRVDDPQFGQILMIVEFASIGDHDIESFIRGYQPTAVWLNEVDEMPPGSLGLLYQRCGRAFLSEKPDVDEVPPVEYSKIFGDLNAPDEDNWFNEDYILKTPEDCELWVQPSGFSPNAENLAALRRIDPNYYTNLAKRMRADSGEWAVRRFIENKTGYSRSGEPVYQSYNDEIHVASELMEPYPGSPIILGIDQGLTPAVAFCQAPGERFLILSELVTPEGDAEGAKDMGRRAGRHLLANYPGFARRGGFVLAPDPACRQRGHDTRQWIEHFRAGMVEIVGCAPVQPPVSNDIKLRIGPVNAYLNTMARGEPALQLHPRCRYMRRGFNGGYRLERVQGKDRVFRDKPDKGPYSHIMNAMEYAAMIADPAKAAPADEHADAALGYGAPGSKRQAARRPQVKADFDF